MRILNGPDKLLNKTVKRLHNVDRIYMCVLSDGIKFNRFTKSIQFLGGIGRKRKKKEMLKQRLGGATN